MGKGKLNHDPGQCTGCRLCELWCSVSHFGAVNPEKTRIWILRDPCLQADTARICRQCEDPACLSSCAFEALRVCSETGAVSVDEEACVRCGACADACPYGAARMPPEGGCVMICDLCDGDPQCVRHCPERALRLGSAEGPAGGPEGECGDA